MRNQKKLKEQIKIGSRVLVRSTVYNYHYCVTVYEWNGKEIKGRYLDLNLDPNVNIIKFSPTVFPFPYYEILDVF